MSTPVSLPRVLNEVNIVKQEVESNKQILLTILSTIKSFKADTLKSYSVLYSKIEDVDNKVNKVSTALNEIIGPSVAVDTSNNYANDTNDTYNSTTTNETYDGNTATTNRGESENIPNNNINGAAPSIHLFPQNEMIKLEDLKEEPIDENSWREDFNEDASFEGLDQAYDTSLTYELPSNKTQKRKKIKQKNSKGQSPDLSTNTDFISSAKSPRATKKQVGGPLLKCRVGCINCERPPCRMCKRCIQRKRCQLRECEEYKKILKAKNTENVHRKCPNCTKTFASRSNLERHTKKHSCVDEDREYDERYFKYQHLMIRCSEVNCPDPIYKNYISFARHRTISGHKNWKYRCDICKKFEFSKKMKRHMANHAMESLEEVPEQISADSVAHVHISEDDFEAHVQLSADVDNAQVTADESYAHEDIVEAFVPENMELDDIESYSGEPIEKYPFI